MRVRRLTQQYAVDAQAKIEYSRLTWVRNNQTTVRAEKYQGLHDAISQGDGVNAGRRIILPPTITGSPYYYNELFQNSMTVVRHMGKRDFFITFTTNHNWQEIQEALLLGEKPSDRPNICARVFKMYHDNLIDAMIKKKKLFIMDDECKLRSPESNDKVISCEIPNKNENPVLHQIIAANNIHGPCGATSMQCPCIEGVGHASHCTKGYPRAFRNTTIARDNFYQEYRRISSEQGGFTHNREYNVDNKWVVPYNPFLSLKYGAHINVEIVNSVEAIKYLYKYITKDNDKVTFAVESEKGQEQAVHDEIGTFFHTRYISASEAYWRIY